MGAELRQRQVLPVALLRDRAALGGLPGHRLVPVYRVSFCVCNGGGGGERDSWGVDLPGHTPGRLMIND